ncbi:hypothetical protein [Marilutibacter aestuarii]|uniref:Uncharacterized protein n=1 Tax=Marilutibacter aestuarii TaxID=1706195 RepID=A0A507ZXY9_9GAMM|nr:hypothetical protein [Lysobacter aestuarii]TQD42369.1 hypothetical protein FKV25_11840 [Lysobacter aestuarii]
MFNRRYFVTYKRWNGSETETATSMIGRFRDQEFAERRARERYGAPGSEILNIRPETDFEANCYKGLRFVVRALRISVAAVIALLAFAWLWDFDSDVGHIPLGELTLNMIFSRLFDVALLLGAGWLCWVIAFGDGPEIDR